MSERKNKEQPKNAIYGTEHTVRIADTTILQWKLKSTSNRCQRSPKKVMSPNKQQLRSPGGEYVSTSEKARKLEEGIISESTPKV